MPRTPSLLSALARLQGTSFSRRVLEEGIRVDSAAFERPKGFAVESVAKRVLTESEYHAMATSFSLAHLLGVIEQLVHTAGYLHTYRRTSSMASVGTTRASDIVYHLEGFLIRAVMFRDRTLQLVSAVCHTGLDVSTVSARSIGSNRIVVSSGLASHLKRLDKLCAPFAPARNQVVHQHGLLDSDVRRVEGLLLASRLLAAPQRAVAASAYRRFAGELGRKKAVESAAFARDAITFTNALLGALEPQYELRQRQLALANA